MSWDPMRALLGLLALPLFMWALPGCDDARPQCVIDTDCPLGMRCALDMTCQRIAGLDAGLAIDAGGGAGDAGSGSDGAAEAGAPMDAGADVGSPSCPGVVGEWRMDSATPECMFTMFGSIRVWRGEAGACHHQVMAEGPGPTGEFELEPGGNFRAEVTLNESRTTCTGTFEERRATFTCGACEMTFTRP